MPLSAPYRTKFLNQITRGTSFPTVATAWLALHTADPGDSGTGNMVNSTWVAVEFNAPASTTGVNATTVDCASVPAATITHFSLWDTSATGTATCMFTGRIWGSDGSATSKVTNAGDTLRFTSGNLRIRLTS